MLCNVSPDWFRTLVESLDDVVFRYRLRPSRGVEYVSPRIFELTGRTPAEFYADPELARLVMIAEDRPLVDRLFAADPALLGRAQVLRCRHLDGRLVSIEYRATLVADDAGGPAALEGVARNVTEFLAVQTRLRESEQQLRKLAASVEEARESERASVARELHDELGQSLTALKMQLSRTARSLMAAGIDHESIEGLQAIVGGVEVATETVRRLATALRPPALDHLGLVAAIELEAGALSKRTGIRCRVSGNRRLEMLDPPTATSIFRIVQEALTNVVRHASASAITIQIDETPEGVRIAVQDNGRGITGAQVDDPFSIGLLGMRERAELIGATLAIESRPRRGTAVVLTLAPGRAGHGSGV